MKAESIVQENTDARIIIVDDHPLIREGIAQALTRQGGWTICGETGRISKAMQLVDTSKPDLVLIDISLEDGSGLDLIELLAKRHPNLPIVVITMHDEPMYVERAFKVGARGYFSKRESIRNLAQALQSVLEGKIFVSEFAANRVFQAMKTDDNEPSISPTKVLSRRELEIFQLLGEGLRRHQIAERLHLSVKTVGTHFERMKFKLELDSAGDLARSAIHWARKQTPS